MITKGYIFDFGKYKGLRIEEVLAEDPWYIMWCVKNVKTIQFEEEIISQAKSYVESNKDFSHINNWAIINGY